MGVADVVASLGCMGADILDTTQWSPGCLRPREKEDFWVDMRNNRPGVVTKVRGMDTTLLRSRGGCDNAEDECGFR